MSLNISGSPRYLGCSTNNPSITGAIKSYRMYNTNSASCSIAEISSTNSTNTNRSMDKTQIAQNPTVATVPEENGKNNFNGDPSSNNKTGINLISDNETKQTKITPAVITKKKLRPLKIKELNDYISCNLCHGYLINPITIDFCIHSYCRSCIVKHLTKLKYCPDCGEHTKEINLSNLKSDDTLKTLVYKLIPGLYQKECERHLQFNNDNKIPDMITESEEEDYFSPVEPISLSLEYHPVSLEGSFIIDKVPPVKYLQCPAAVTVHHLKRFICSKFGIDPKNERIQIQIIHDDEILPEYFSLMDIGYIFNWKRIAPMKFFYQILVHTICNKSNESDQNCKKEIIEKTNEAIVKRINSSNVQKCVRFKDDIEFKNDNNNEEQNYEITKIKNTIIQTIPIDNKTDKINNSNNNNNDKHHNNLEQDRITNNDVKQNQNFVVKKEKDKKQLKIELSRSNINNLKNKNTELQTTISNKQIINDDENVKVSSSSSSSIASASPSSSSNDFKSLRSNDVRYDFPSIPTNGNLKIKNNINKTNNSQNKISNLDCEILQKPVSKCDIVVSIPQAHIHRASNSSDDSFENLSLAQLKTANKKGAVSPRENNTDLIFEQQKIVQDIPKLKIELPSLKTKFTMPKKVNDSKTESKKSTKKRKLSIEEPQPITHEVDITTYAKVIGLKPINPIPDVKRDLNPKNSPDASPASATSSSGASSIFAFNSEISSTTSHKKRKKGKHSKQSKDGKRRKLHAEISSQPADESLKFKLKLTGNHKMHKSERKINDESANISSVEKKICEEKDDNKKKSVQANEIIIENEQMNKNKIDNKEQLNKNTIDNKEQLNKNTIDNSQKKQLEGIPNQNNLNKNGTIVNHRDILPNKITNPTQQTGNNNKIRTTVASCTINNISNSPKYIPTTTIPSPSIPIEGHPIKSVGLSNEILTKSLPQKVISMQDPKLLSPPLPPSLFKTTPMSLQTITTTSAKPLIQPRMPVHFNIRQQMHMQAVNRKIINNRATAANFIVPNPPRGIASSAPQTYPINSIASAAHRQAAQFKRSASLDSSPISLTKKIKQEQDRFIPNYATKQHQQATIIPKTTTTLNSFQTSGQSNMNMSRTTSSPVSISTIGNNNNTSLEQFYYTPSLGPTYTHENLTRSILIPPSSVSVTKMTETFAPNLNHPSGLTITPQLHQQSITPFQFPQSNKPALEIVRISSNIPPADQQKLLITNNNTIKQNIPKTTRPPPPQIPLVKIKRSMSQSQPIKPTITNITAQSQIAQINNNLIEKKSADDGKNNNVVRSDGVSQILDLSGKSSRSPSREKSNSPCLTTSSPKPIPQKDIKSNSGNNLEAALTKLKQQQQQNSSQYTNSLNTQIVNQQILNNNNLNQNNSNVGDKTKQTNDNSNSLQNLQMLSESAINREKIIINTQQRTLPKLPKLNEISKMRGNATVRQQNASVRNIPNPSALVFRNNQQIPMLASITKTSSPPKLNTISTTSSTVISDQKIIDCNKMNVSTTTSSQLGITCSTSTTSDTSKLIASKKNLNIEQLAANLNMRAAAAADNTIKNTDNSNNISKLTPPTTTTVTEQNNTIVSSNCSTTSYSTIPLAVSSTSSSTTSPVTVSASLNNV